MSRTARSLILCITALASACGGGGSQPTGQANANASSGGNNAAMGDGDGGAGVADAAAAPQPPQMAHLRVIHASPDPAAMTVAIYLDGAQSPAIASLAYRAVAGYTDVPSGVRQVAVRPASAAASTEPVLRFTTPDLAPDRSYTIIAHGLVGAEPRATLIPIEDNAPLPEAGHAHVRFFHALAGVGAVDVCIAGARPRDPGTPVYPNVAYGQFGTPAQGQGNYADVPSGAGVRLQVRAQNARPCTGALLGVVTVTPPDRAVATAIAIGRVGSPAVTKELLVCTDAPMPGPSGCNSLAIAAR